MNGGERELPAVHSAPDHMAILREMALDHLAANPPRFTHFSAEKITGIVMSMSHDELLQVIGSKPDETVCAIPGARTVLWFDVMDVNRGI